MGCDVLIVGAGPTGLVLALWLTKLGVKVRIVDKTAEPGTTSRALAVQARTLELYRQLDLADAGGRARPQGSGGQSLGQGRRCGPPAVRLHRSGPDALFFHGNLSAGPARTAADRAAAGAWRFGRAANRTVGVYRHGRSRHRPSARPDRRTRIAKRAISRDATARVPSSARRSGRDSPAGPTGRFSMSLMSRRADLRSTASCTSISTRPISSRCFRWPAKDGRA